MAVLAALRQAESPRGTGQVIDLSLRQPQLSILVPGGGLTEHGRYRPDRTIAPRSARPAMRMPADGGWVALSASTQAMAERLFSAIGRPDMPSIRVSARTPTGSSMSMKWHAVIGAFIRVLSAGGARASSRRRETTVGPVYDAAGLRSP